MAGDALKLRDKFATNNYVILPFNRKQNWDVYLGLNKKKYFHNHDSKVSDKWVQLWVTKTARKCWDAAWRPEMMLGESSFYVGYFYFF